MHVRLGRVPRLHMRHEEGTSHGFLMVLVYRRFPNGDIPPFFFFFICAVRMYPFWLTFFPCCFGGFASLLSLLPGRGAYLAYFCLELYYAA